MTCTPSRYLYARPLKNKSQVAVIDALKEMFDCHGCIPAQLDTDRGTEFGDGVTRWLEAKNTAHRLKDPQHVNGLAVVDAAIRQLKERIARAMADTGDRSWAGQLAGAVKAHNSISHGHLMDSAPEDVKGNEALQYALMKQEGKDQLLNIALHHKRVSKLAHAGAFRTLLPKSTWARANTPKFSGKVHLLHQVAGQEAVDTEGNRYPLREVLPVAAQDARPLPEAKAPLDEGRRTKLRDYADALNGFVGSQGNTLQMAGTKMRQVPGFSRAMEKARIQGVGAMERFIRLFPELFEIAGERQQKRVLRS